MKFTEEYLARIEEARKLCAMGDSTEVRSAITRLAWQWRKGVVTPYVILDVDKQDWSDFGQFEGHACESCHQGIEEHGVILRDEETWRELLCPGTWIVADDIYSSDWPNQEIVNEPEFERRFERVVANPT